MRNNKKHLIADKWLDETLASPPELMLSVDFADKVAANAIKRFAWEEYLKEFYIYLGVFAGIVGISVAMAFIWLGADWHEWQNFIVRNLSLVAGLVLLGLFVLFVDRVLLRYFFFRFSNKSIS